DQIPYCYDPSTIEALRQRADCLLNIWEDHYDDLSLPARNRLNTFLAEHFSYAQEIRNDLPVPITHDGFERLYAELLILQGDESVTRAFASRYDLAGQAIVSFEGSLFETDGIDLSGVAGFEMYSLYQGAQYYSEALDRFYALAPTLYQALQYGQSSRNFVTSELVTAYIERLIRASTQRTRAASEIAKRYQNFNRPDLARRVIERAFAAGYLESIVMSRMMLRIVEVSDIEGRAQLKRQVESAALRYRTALLDMRNVYNDITDQINFFGFAPDYIPFPTVDTRGGGEGNAFEQAMSRALNKLRVAREREELAISADRSFETDTAQFQSELVRIRNTYENQLAEVCGTFEGEDGRVYPGIARYAERSGATAVLGDPCGLVGNGEIHNAQGQVSIQYVELQRLQVQSDNVLESIDIERRRVAQQCGLIQERANFVYEQQGEIISLEDDIATFRTIIRNLEFGDRLANTALQAVTGTLSCGEMTLPMSIPGCVAAIGGSYAVYGAAQIGFHAGIETSQQLIRQREREITEINRETARYETLAQCDAALIDSNARTLDLILRLKELELEMLRADYQLKLTMSDVQRLQNRAQRLQLEQAETEQLAINVEAARNDPNIRIYRNDAIINAEISFNDALQQLYRATRVFEYYTSQSYANRDQLFLIRLTSRGDTNLENYQSDLQNAFFEFEESFGLPDTRVQVISLLNDILDVPRIDEQGRPLTSSQREAIMHRALRDPARLNPQGHLTLPFSTNLDELSPLTRNHKILFVEAEISASDKGDDVARLYLRQQGTHVVRSVDDTLQFYRFPSRTAVINPFFNGNRYFTPEVYRTNRLRDRPVASTAWELLINQRDEAANRDLNLQSITDIRLFVYYTDFTQLD
ncbi:MAG: hypothetical protein AAFS10_13960, partial [Myxococcota bacterium]